MRWKNDALPELEQVLSFDNAINSIRQHALAARLEFLMTSFSNQWQGESMKSPPVDANQKLIEFKTLLYELANLHENLWIEKELYRQLLMQHLGATPEILEDQVNEARLDPHLRRTAREVYSGIWESMNESGVSLLIEVLLSDYSPKAKPN